MRGYVLFPFFVQARWSCVTRPTRCSRESDYMHVDQIPCTHRRQRQVSKVVGNHLASAPGTGERLGKWSVISRLTAQCSVVFFQLNIGRALVGRPNLYAALNNLRLKTIQGTIPVAAIIVFVSRNGPSSMGQRFQGARYVFVNSKRLTTKSALDEVLSRPGIRFYRNKTLLTHDP